MYFEFFGPAPTPPYRAFFRFKKTNSGNFCGGQNGYYNYILVVDYKLEHQSAYQTLRKYQWGPFENCFRPPNSWFSVFWPGKESKQQNLLCKTCSWKITLIFFKWKTTSILLQMEDNLNILANGRRPQYFCKWNTTSIFWQMKDDLNLLANGRRPKYFGKWKTTSIF